MSDIVIGLLVSTVVFSSGLCVLLFHPRLPTHHRTTETRDAVRLGTAMISILASLVLGLLIATAKRTFDTADQSMRSYAADFILLDRTLRDYGPDADGVRALLKDYLGRTIRRTWPQTIDGAHEPLEDPLGGSLLDRSFQETLALKPTNEQQAWLHQQALGSITRLIRMRWSILVNQTGTTSPVTITILVAWIVAIFASFGLNAPRNATVIAAFLICALSIGAAMFLILDLDKPFSGLIMISAAPMKNALAHLSH